MTQEEKELLLKDLCARFPYGIKVSYTTPPNIILKEFDVIGIPFVGLVDIMKFGISRFAAVPIEKTKPYLRPMSSMTDEEKDFLSKNGFTVNPDGSIDNNCDITGQGWDNCYVDTESVDNALEMLNSHHLDWRGLIQMGLALEAPKDMYTL